MSATEDILARHEDTLRASIREVQRLRDDLTVALAGLDTVASVKAADLADLPVKVNRLLSLQNLIRREDTTVRQLTARAAHGAA